MTPDTPHTPHPPTPARPRTSYRGPVAVVGLALLLLSAFLGQTFSTIRTTAPTYDEVAHLPAGYAQLMTGQVTFNPEHPPLAKLIAAAALWPDGGRPDDLSPGWRRLDEWQFGRLFLSGPGRDPTALLARARRGPIALGLLLCLVCFAWSFRLYGPAGGLFTLAMCVFSPTLLAHSRLVATDVPLAAFGVLTALLTWELMNRATFPRAVGVGLALGAALASKFSGLVLVPPVGLAVAHALWLRLRARRPEQPTDLRRAALRAASMALAALATAATVVALSYGWPPSFQGYLDGIASVGANHPAAWEVYLLDQYRDGSFKLYFPVAFLLKTSPAVLLGLLLLAALPLLRRVKCAGVVRAAGADARLLLWLIPVAYGAFIMQTAPNIGIRYLIPLYPFLFVALGLMGAALWVTRAGKVLFLMLVAMHVRAAVQAWPDPISYFNGLLGCSGPAAIHCLTDSNFDWGQDLGRVGEAVNRIRKTGDEVALLYGGTADPSAYMYPWRRMEDPEFENPRPQIYAVSIRELRRVVDDMDEPTQANWFRRFKPTVVVGNTYFIYDFRPGHTSGQSAPDR